MSRKCIECGKIISGSVVDHYRDHHFGSYIRNGEDVIRRNPSIFAPEIGTERAQQIQTSTAKTKLQKTYDKVDTNTPWDREAKKRSQAIVKLIVGGCEDQTYRDGKIFTCAVCQRQKSTGRHLMSYSTRFTICYDCYRTIKQANPGKRGNKHVFINTPM